VTKDGTDFCVIEEGFAEMTGVRCKETWPMLRKDGKSEFLEQTREVYKLGCR
jgi:hypothetical protein